MRKLNKFSKITVVAFMLWAVISCSGGGGSSETQSTEEKLSLSDSSTTLGWPLDCAIGTTCNNPIGFPDIDSDWTSFNCTYPAFLGHSGTDIKDNNSTVGLSVFAAADGQVLWVFDGKYDQCNGTDSTHPDCQEPTLAPGPGVSSGIMSCTENKTEYCDDASSPSPCFQCTWGGNEIVIKHEGLPGILATRYEHLRSGSILVRPGEMVYKGQKIAEMGSSGRSSFAHLHFEVLGLGFNNPLDPWAGQCGSNKTQPLWDAGIQEAVDIISRSGENINESLTCNEQACSLVNWDPF